MIQKWILVYAALLVISFGDCGVFTRNFNNNNNNNNNNNAYGNGGRYIGPAPKGVNSDLPQKTTGTTGTTGTGTTASGLSAWGIITLILLVILVGMIGYYSFLCYPLICSDKLRSYNIMDTESTSSGTPTQTASDFDKFEKIAYSSRSTTPSKSQASHE